MFKKTLQVILLILIAVNSLYASIFGAYSTKDMNSEDAAIARLEARLQRLARIIPYERGPIGYLGNEDMPSIPYDAADAAAEYTLIQYVLAPFILVKGTDQEWVILNLDQAGYQTWFRDNHDQFRIRALGANLYLIHRLDE